MGLDHIQGKGQHHPKKLCSLLSQSTFWGTFQSIYSTLLLLQHYAGRKIPTSGFPGWNMQRHSNVARQYDRDAGRKWRHAIWEIIWGLQSMKLTRSHHPPTWYQYPLYLPKKCEGILHIYSVSVMQIADRQRTSVHYHQPAPNHHTLSPACT